MASKVFKNITCVRASALAQMEVLSIITGNVISHWSNMSEPVDDPAETFLLPFVLGLPFVHKQKLVDLLMSDLTDKEGVYVDIESFNGDMMEWHRLMAQVLYWNLNDFFTYIDSAHRSDLAKLKDKAAQ